MSTSYLLAARILKLVRAIHFELKFPTELEVSDLIVVAQQRTQHAGPEHRVHLATGTAPTFW